MKRQLKIAYSFATNPWSIAALLAAWIVIDPTREILTHNKSISNAWYEISYSASNLVNHPIVRVALIPLCIAMLHKGYRQILIQHDNLETIRKNLIESKYQEINSYLKQMDQRHFTHLTEISGLYAKRTALSERMMFYFAEQQRSIDLGNAILTAKSKVQVYEAVLRARSKVPGAVGPISGELSGWFGSAAENIRTVLALAQLDLQPSFLSIPNPPSESNDDLEIHRVLLEEITNFLTIAENSRSELNKKLHQEADELGNLAKDRII